METISVIALIISAVATATIAVYAWKTHKLATTIKEGDDRTYQKMRDLHRAIVISNLCVAGRMYGTTDFQRGLGTFIGIFDMVREGERLFEPASFKTFQMPKVG